MRRAAYVAAVRASIALVPGPVVGGVGGGTDGAGELGGRRQRRSKFGWECAFLDQDPCAGPYRDGSSCAGLQVETGHENIGHQPHNGGDEGLRAVFGSQTGSILAAWQSIRGRISKALFQVKSKQLPRQPAVTARISQ